MQWSWNYSEGDRRTKEENTFLDNLNGGAQFRIERERLCQFQHLLANTRQHLGILVMVERFNDPGAGLGHFFLPHAAGGEGLRTNANSTGLERGIGIERNSILVDGNSGLAQSIFRFTAQNAVGKYVNQHQ